MLTHGVQLVKAQDKSVLERSHSMPAHSVSVVPPQAEYPDKEDNDEC